MEMSLLIGFARWITFNKKDISPLTNEAERVREAFMA